MSDTTTNSAALTAVVLMHERFGMAGVRALLGDGGDTEGER